MEPLDRQFGFPTICPFLQNNCNDDSKNIQEDRKEIQRKIWQMIRLNYRSRTKDCPVKL